MLFSRNKTLYAVLSSVILLTGCSNMTDSFTNELTHKQSNKPTETTRSITIWVEKNNQSDAGNVEPYFEDFEASHGVSINFEQKNSTNLIYDYEKTDESDRPDLLIMDSSRLAFAVSEQVVSPLNFSTEEIARERKRYVPVAWNAMSLSGITYGIPNAISAPLFAYNSTLLKDAPLSLEELLVPNTERVPFDKSISYVPGDSETKLTEEEITKIESQTYPFLIDWDYYLVSYPFFHQNNETLFSLKNGIYEPSKLNISSPDVINRSNSAYSFMSTIAAPSYFWNSKRIFDSFKEGTIASTLLTPDRLLELKNEESSFHVARYPSFNGQKLETFANVSGWFLSTKGASNPFISEFLHVLNSDSEAISRYETAGEITPLHSLSNTKSFKHDLVLQSTLNDSHQVFPSIPEADDILVHADNALSLFLTKRQTAEEAWNDASYMISHQIEWNHGYIKKEVPK